MLCVENALRVPDRKAGSAFNQLGFKVTTYCLSVLAAVGRPLSLRMTCVAGT